MISKIQRISYILHGNKIVMDVNYAGLYDTMYKGVSSPDLTMEPIVVGYDAQSLTGKHQTGLGVYSKHLARILERHPETLKLKLLWPKGRKSFKRTIERLRWEQYDLVMAAHRESVQILHVPCFSAPRFTSLPTVVTAHDMIVTKHPNLMPPGSRWYFSKWIPASYKSADHVIAVSALHHRCILPCLNI